MDKFKVFLDKIDNLDNRLKLEKLFEQIIKDFPELDTRVAWNQPMFTHHSTFIIAFSVAKAHFSVALEKEAADEYEKRIEAKYSKGKMLFRIKWTDEVDYELIKDVIKYTIEDKKDCKTFWK